MNGSAPCKKINWLKGLLDDDGDSSDATSKEHKSMVKPHRSGSNAIGPPGDKKHKQGGEMLDKRKRYKTIGASVEEGVSGKLSTRRRSEGEERRLHHKRQLEESHIASVVDMKNAEREHKHLRIVENKDSNMIQRKRSHAASEVMGSEKVEVHLENTTDHAKAEAAAQRQRRMRKLRARRMATGEHQRLAAVKLKRQELSVASRLKRNQRAQIRKTQKPEKLDADAVLDPEVKEEGNIRQSPRPGNGAKEGKPILARQRRAAIKEKKQVGAGTNSSFVSTLKRPQSGDSEVRHGLGADFGDKASHKRQKSKHMKEGFERASSGISHDHSPKKTIESQVSGEVSIVAAIYKIQDENGILDIPSSSNNTSICVSDSQNPSAKYHESCRDNTIQADDVEEGQVSSSALVKGLAANPLGECDTDEKNICDAKKDLLLEMAPIPRKSIRDTSVGTSASSFVIPKRSVKIEDGKDEGRSISARPQNPVNVKPTSSNPQLSSRDPICPQQKRSKNPVPVKSSMLSAQDHSLMRLARKRNSIFLAAAELTAQQSPIDNKVSDVRMASYNVCDVDGNVLPDLVLRLSCATKRDMNSDKDLFNTSFFGVSQVAPKAKGKVWSTVDECAEVTRRKINCYEVLRFDRPEDRDNYQRRMYGSTFVPQYLRGRATIIIRNARFERKSTGIRFNQDRDREEFAASLRKRYSFEKTVPRCEIPRENWQKLMRNQPGFVYLHYNNREDAERAARVFRDDDGNPLELKTENKLRVGRSRNHSPTNGVGYHRAPRRSFSSERSPPKTSPLPSQNDSTCTPQSHRERQWVTYRYSRYDPPSAQRNGQKDHPGHTVRGRRSRSRSKSRFPDEEFDPGRRSDAGNEEVPANMALLSVKPKDESTVHTRGPLATENVGNAEHQSSNIMNKRDRSGDTEANTQQRAALLMSSSSRTTIQSEGHHLESGEEEQEDGEIEDSTVSVAETIDRSEDRGQWQSNRSPPRSWRQSSDVQCHQLQGDYRGRPYSQYYNRGPSRRRSRSRSRPRPAPWGRGDHCDAGTSSYAKERPVHDYDIDGHGRRTYSGEMDRYRGRDCRGGGYNDRRADAYSRHY